MQVHLPLGQGGPAAYRPGVAASEAETNSIAAELMVVEEEPMPENGAENGAVAARHRRRRHSIGSSSSDEDDREGRARPNRQPARGRNAAPKRTPSRERDDQVGQWVRASAITPPPADSIASSSVAMEDWQNNAGGRPPKYGQSGRKKARLPRIPSELTCRPSLVSMRQMSAEDLAAVRDFTIIRRGFGSVSFNVPGHELTDVRGLDLKKGDGALVWEGEAGSCTAVHLFPDSAAHHKPPVGHGINKAATITLAFRPGLDPLKLRMALAQQPGVSFQSYDIETGAVTFVVDHL